MRESHLSKIEERLIRPYLLRRADYSTSVRDLDDMGEGNPVSSNGQISTTTSTSNSVALNGVAQGAVFGGAGISEAEKDTRLKGVLSELERWSKEEDAQVNTRNMEQLKM